MRGWETVWACWCVKCWFFPPNLFFSKKLIENVFCEEVMDLKALLLSEFPKMLGSKKDIQSHTDHRRMSKIPNLSYKSYRECEMLPGIFTAVTQNCLIIAFVENRHSGNPPPPHTHTPKKYLSSWRFKRHYFFFSRIEHCWGVEP